MCVVKVVGMCPVIRLIVDRRNSRFGTFDYCDIGIKARKCVGTSTW